MSATIKDIARETGLAYATISAFLNGTTVREKNKIAIEAAVKKLGYVRNEYARGLKIHQSMTIGVLIPELSNLFSTTIISKIEDVLREAGYAVIVCDCRSDVEIEKQSIRFLTSKMVDGLIVMPLSSDGGVFETPLKNNLPVVVIDRMTDSTQVSHIVINNREISQKAVAALTRKGHKHIALISGDIEVYTAMERRAGYQQELEKIFAFKEEYIYDGGLTTEGGYKAMKQIIREYPKVDALFVTNYEMTLGAIIALQEEGKKIPSDYSFIGFDNMELNRVFTPELAMIHQPMDEIGTRSAQLLLKLMKEKENRVNQNIVLEAVFTQGVSII